MRGQAACVFNCEVSCIGIKKCVFSELMCASIKHPCTCAEELEQDYASKTEPDMYINLFGDAGFHFAQIFMPKLFMDFFVHNLQI